MRIMDQQVMLVTACQLKTLLNIMMYLLLKYDADNYITTLKVLMWVSFPLKEHKLSLVQVELQVMPWHAFPDVGQTSSDTLQCQMGAMRKKQLGVISIAVIGEAMPVYDKTISLLGFMTLFCTLSREKAHPSVNPDPNMKWSWWRRSQRELRPPLFS